MRVGCTLAIACVYCLGNRFRGFGIRLPDNSLACQIVQNDEARAPDANECPVFSLPDMLDFFTHQLTLNESRMRTADPLESAVFTAGLTETIRFTASCAVERIQGMRPLASRGPTQ